MKEIFGKKKVFEDKVNSYGDRRVKESCLYIYCMNREEESV